MSEQNKRILIIDDNESIHDDFRKIFGVDEVDDPALDEMESAFFGKVKSEPVASTHFEIDSAYQGEEGLAKLQLAIAIDEPYAMAFVDMRMPPGWDGLQTILRLWQVDPQLQIVLCTAYSDYSWEETIQQLGESDRLLILKKPFDPIEVRQIACALTEKWHAERFSELKLEELHRLVEERTKEIQAAQEKLIVKNEQLAHARNEADAANQSKSAFLANMSHEIRTPMTAILGFAELLHGDRKTIQKSLPDYIDAIETIKRNSEFLLEIINDILDLSKIESGKLDVEAISCSPCAIVSEVASLMRMRADKKNLPIHVEYQGRIPQVIQTDPTRVRQVLINLLSNAVKFTEKGQVTVTTRLLQEESGNPLLQIEINDSGIGMTKEQLEKVFQPFIQADSSTTRKFGGTGLGLTISKRLSKMLGGELTVSSTPGSGTSFTMTVATGSLVGVEMLDKPQDADFQQASQEIAEDFENLQIPYRILLAEDGPDNQRLISFILEKAGASVSLAENGKQALDMALQESEQGTPFDVILMDMQMPEMDGYDATRQLRDRGYRGEIIALTAHAMSGDDRKCLDAGCNAYATKPVNRGKLLSIIKTHIDALAVAH